MNKKDLAAQIAEKSGLTSKKVNEVIDIFCDIVGTTLKNGESVRLVGFGNFSTRKRAARAGRNLRSGEQINIPESIVPVFKAGKLFKDKVKSE